MTNVINYLAEGSAEKLPLEHGNNLLLPMPYDLVWSAVAFAVIIFLFWKFVLPKYSEVLAEREDTISSGIQNAADAEAKAAAAREEYNAQLAEARAEAAQIREEARDKGKEIIAEKTAEATAEYNRIVASGEKQLQAQREQVITELRRDMGQTSISLAERLLGQQLSENVTRSGTIDSFLNELDTVAPAGK